MLISLSKTINRSKEPMKLVFFIILITISNSSFSSQIVPGIYTTVNQSECSSEIHFFKNGKGEFIDSCRDEDGSIFGKVYKDNISWSLKNYKVFVRINGILETFTYHNELSCAHFGGKGVANGLEGFGYYFWRMPVKCK